MDICILLKTIFVNNYISKMMKIKEKNNLHRTTQTKSNTWKSGWKNVRWSINLLTEYWQAEYTVTSQMWPIHQILAKYTKIWGVGALFSLFSRELNELEDLVRSVNHSHWPHLQVKSDDSLGVFKHHHIYIHIYIVLICTRKNSPSFPFYILLFRIIYIFCNNTQNK